MKYIIKIKLYKHKYKPYNKNFDVCNISATIQERFLGMKALR